MASASERLRELDAALPERRNNEAFVGAGYSGYVLCNALPEIIAVVEAAERSKEYLDWAVDVEIPKHESALTAELREQTGRDDINAQFDSPLPALRDALAQTFDALASKLSGEGQG